MIYSLSLSLFLSCIVIPIFVILTVFFVILTVFFFVCLFFYHETQLHHGKHHQAYVNNLNVAEEKYAEALVSLLFLKQEERKRRGKKKKKRKKRNLKQNKKNKINKQLIIYISIYLPLIMIRSLLYSSYYDS